MVHALDASPVALGVIGARYGAPLSLGAVELEEALTLIMGGLVFSACEWMKEE